MNDPTETVEKDIYLEEKMLANVVELLHRKVELAKWPKEERDVFLLALWKKKCRKGDIEAWKAFRTARHLHIDRKSLPMEPSDPTSLQLRCAERIRATISLRRRKIGISQFDSDSLPRSGVGTNIGTLLRPVNRGAYPIVFFPFFRKSRFSQTASRSVVEFGSYFGHASAGLGSKLCRLDSGSTLHVPVRKFPETTESSCFIDTRGTYRSARNDDRRDDSP